MPFLIRRNREAELRSIVTKLAPQLRLTGQERFVVPAADKAEGWSACSHPCCKPYSSRALR